MSLKTLLGDKYREDITLDEVAAALENVELPDMSGYIKKTQFDKTASELADWKRKYNAKLTEEEQKAQAEADAKAAMESEFAELKRKVAIAEHTKKFLSLGYDEKLAEETAAAWLDGDSETVFKNQAQFLETQKRAMTEELLNNTPTPPSGGDSQGITKEQFGEMGYSERLKLFQENEQLFNELNS